MGVMVDYREVSNEDLKMLRAQMKEALLEMVSKAANRPKSDLIVRDILPLTDLGLGSEEWDNETELVASAWTEDWHHQLDDDQGIVFYGVRIHDDDFDIMFARLKLGATGATVKDLVSVQAIDNGVQHHNRGYFSPVYYEPGETPYVDYYARDTVAAAACHIELVGLFCEPRGEQIS